MERYNHEDNRPSPESFLEEARKEGRGKLKIFLGASPGVGKTYAMLGDATVLKREGADVVVGIVETHGRKETEAQTQGLEIIPRREIIYREKAFLEMDIDAILQRRPDVVLVDELAHTNIEGSRHPKRYQDVEELLDAGMDVYSTINIQHIESLNDVVSRISGVQVKETVPDRILQMADEIELVDIPPKELQKRLQEGKVYVPAQAQQAIKHFFTQSNLTALREMALRFTAERVDSQMLQIMQAQGIRESWPTRERIMVCIGDDYDGMELVRACHQTATQWKAPWIALHVNTDKQATISSESDYTTQSLQLAEELGGEVVTLAAGDIIGEILEFSKSRNVSHIIVGKPPKKKWFKFFSEPFAIELYKRSNTIKVILVPTGDIVLRERSEEKTRQKKAAYSNWKDYIAATFASMMAAAIAYTVQTFLPLPNLSLIFLLAVLYISMWHGLWPSLYTIALSSFTYIFFFSEPRFSFTFVHKEDILTLFFFVLIASIISRQASRVRKQVQTVQQNATRTASLYEFSKRISAARDTDTVFRAIVQHVMEILDVKVTLLLPEDDALKVVSGHPNIDEISKGAATWAWKRNENAGYSTSTLPASNWFFIPMKTDSGVIGVLGIEFPDKSKVLLPNQKRILDAISHQAAVAIERTQLSETISEAKIYGETEKLRSALLSSISHDFYLPIETIMLKVGTLRAANKLTQNECMESLDVVYKEVSRMDRFVKNLIEMTKGGHSKLEVKRNWVNLKEIVTTALERCKSLIGDRKISLDIKDDLPMMFVDSILIEQVLFNSICNVCDLSDADKEISYSAHSVDEDIVIGISYFSNNLTNEELEQLISGISSYKSTKLGQQYNTVALRFTICHGIIEAHGGKMTASSDNGKVKITISFPFHPLDINFAEPDLDEEIGKIE